MIWFKSSVPVVVFVFISCGLLLYCSPVASDSKPVDTAAQVNPAGNGEKVRSIVSHPETMITLAMIEEELYDFIKSQNLDYQSVRLKRFLDDYESSSKLYKEDYELIAVHPILAHRLIRRFVFLQRSVNDMAEDLIEIKNLLQNAMKETQTVYAIPAFPTMNDVIFSQESLIRIQEYYNLEAADVAYGKLHTLETTPNVGLNAAQCVEMGKYLSLHDKHTLAVEWMEVALDKIVNDGDTSAPKKNVKLLFETMIRKHNTAWKENAYSMYKYVDLINWPKPKRNRAKEVSFAEHANAAVMHRHNPVYGWAMEYNFHSLCAGKNLQTEKEKLPLRCWLETPNVYWTLHPLQIELLNEDPWLIQVYEIVGPKFAENIRSVVDVKRSTVLGDKPNIEGDIILSSRTSYSDWLFEEQHDFSKSFKRKIELVTGLKVEKAGASEALQVATYGYGQHYDCHLDALFQPERTEENGERLATFMLYLTDVEVGGYTAFPVMGTVAKPVPGSAVFWYNLHKNGTEDMRTWHGACPVIMGHKIVGNKWIRIKENFLTRKCSLEQHA